MGELLFVLVSIIWWIVKGIFKLVFAIVLFPFKLIRRCKWEKEIEVEKQQKENEIKAKYAAAKKKIDEIANKIEPQIRGNANSHDTPQRISIFSNRIEVIYNGEKDKQIYFDVDEKETLDSCFEWFSSDGTQSEDKPNEMLLLAEALNKKNNGIYKIITHQKERISDYGQGHKLYTYIMDFVEMTKR